MGKFYKPGRVVVVTNGKYAGKKAIIVKSNFEQTKTRSYPHCLVVGIKKNHKKFTKKNFKKLDELVRSLEEVQKTGEYNVDKRSKRVRNGTTMKFSTVNMNDTRRNALVEKKKAHVTERLERLKRLGVFVKTYNMNHILATRYKVNSNTVITDSLNEVEKKELEARQAATLYNEENQKKSEDSNHKVVVDDLKNKYASAKNNLENSMNNAKVKIGVELFRQLSEGFERPKNCSAEQNETISSNEFLFTKLKF